MKKRREKIGSVRVKLCKLLLEKNVLVAPEDLWVQEGAYRQITWDLARWGSNHARWKDGIAPDGKPWRNEIILSSWSTMTECCNKGIVMDKEDKFDRGWGHISIGPLG